MSEPRRRLKAILSADVAGFTRLMAADASSTVAALNASRARFQTHVDAVGGRIVDTAGDSVLAVFDSVGEATRASLEIQQALRHDNAARPPERQMAFRIGINLGDIIEQDDGTVYGDGVNIAARAEALSEAGAIALSGPAYALVDDDVKARCRDGGEQVVKENERQVRVYHLDIDSVDGPAVRPAGGETATVSRTSRPSIAVLPFDQIGGGDDEAYFADGITEDIITELSRFHELMVTARNSTFAYKGRAVDIRTVGQELGVRYVLEGSVRRAGPRIRVSAQLIETETGHHLWAERYDRKLEDVFEVQDELTRKIVGMLVGKVRDSERRRIRNDSRTENLEAYELVLKGRELWFNFNPEDNLRARALYEQAIALDPQYARAYASLAWTYAMAYNEYWSDDPEGALDRALEHALTGVQLAPTSHTSRNTLGMVYYFRKRLDRSIDSLETAIELNPNDADAYVFLAQSLSLNGEYQRTLEVLEKAFLLNPHLGEWPQSIYVLAHFNGRHYEESRQVFERLETPRIETFRWAAATYACLDRLADAKRYARRYLEAYPEFDLERHLARIPFTSADDLEHYGEALRRAGLVACATADA